MSDLAEDIRKEAPSAPRDGAAAVSGIKLIETEDDMGESHEVPDAMPPTRSRF